MISRQHRFWGRASIDRVHKQGQVQRGRQLNLKYKLGTDNWRLAVVVSKKVAKSAVTRNRIRRRLFEVVRTEQIQKPYDMLLVVHSAELATMPAPELQQQVRALLLKTQISGTITPKKER